METNEVKKEWIESALKRAPNEVICLLLASISVKLLNGKVKMWVVNVYD